MNQTPFQGSLLHNRSKFEVTHNNDDILFLINGLEGLHLFDKPEREWIAAQWRHTLRDQNVTESYDAKRLLKQLLTLRQTTEEPLKQRILALDQEIIDLDQTIAQKESTLSQLTYYLYGLTPAEITMVEVF